MNYILNSLNVVYEQFIGPLFFLLGQGLNTIILQPLVFLQLPVSLQVVVTGFLFAAISIYLRYILKTERHEAEFRRLFASKFSARQDISGISDWKIKSMMYDFADKELDEFFNIYMAQKYVRYAATYLLPLFTGEIWLNSVFSPDKLYDIHCSIYVLPLSENRVGIHGLTVSALFLISWIAGLSAFFLVRKILNKN